MADSATVGAYVGQYCPLAKAAEMLGDRWTLLILRDLLMGAHRFTDIERGLSGISPTLLAQRLRMLEGLGLVERRRGASRAEYWLTPVGKDLEPVVLGLGNWAARNFGHEPTAEDMNSRVLLLWVERSLRGDLLPAGRHVVRFDFTRPRRESLWLLLDEGDATACDEDPGPAADLVVTTALPTLYGVFSGSLSMRAALRDETLRLDGELAMVRSFPRWFAQSPFAEVTRSRVAEVTAGR